MNAAAAMMWQALIQNFTQQQKSGKQKLDSIVCVCVCVFDKMHNSFKQYYSNKKKFQSFERNKKKNKS